MRCFFVRQCCQFAFHALTIRSCMLFILASAHLYHICSKSDCLFSAAFCAEVFNWTCNCLPLFSDDALTLKSKTWILSTREYRSWYHRNIFSRILRRIKVYCFPGLGRIRRLLLVQVLLLRDEVMCHWKTNTTLLSNVMSNGRCLVRRSHWNAAIRSGSLGTVAIQAFEVFKCI